MNIINVNATDEAAILTRAYQSAGPSFDFSEVNGSILDREASQLESARNDIFALQASLRARAEKCWTNEGKDALNELADNLTDCLGDHVNVPLDAMNEELAKR